jgi:tRNA (cytidine/uridine-2'-O-)-methyltransferase
MQIVLFEPQIPQNTGNIARTCAVTGTSLRLIPPMAFQITEKEIKRAGLDYWHLLDLDYIHDPDSWLKANVERCVFFTSKASQAHTEVSYNENSILLFGSETHGLPQAWTSQWPQKCVRLPMRELQEARCLNLATSVGIGLYEALRQTGFQGLYPRCSNSI